MTGGVRLPFRSHVPAVAPDAFAGQVASTMNQSAAAPAHFAAHAAQGVASAYRVVWNFSPPRESIAPNAICQGKYVEPTKPGVPIDVYAAFCRDSVPLRSRGSTSPMTLRIRAPT